MADQYSGRWVKFVGALVLINLLVIGGWYMYEKQKANQDLLNTNQALQQKVIQLEEENAAKNLQETQRKRKT